MHLEFGQTGVSDASGSVTWINLVVRAEPTLLSPLEWVVATDGLFCSSGSIPELHGTPDSCLIEERVDLNPIHLFHLTVGFLQTQEVFIVGRSIDIFPNGNRILFSWWRRRTLAARELSNCKAECCE